MASPKNHFLSGKKIFVAGAGIAGLSFVVALQKQWPAGIPPPSFVICDRDTREASIGREGYTLSLAGHQKDTGLYALLQLGVIEEILKHAVLSNENGGCFKLWTKDWREMISVRFKPVTGLTTGGIRIKRTDLRRILTEAGDGIADIKWSTACVGASRLEDGGMRVRMCNEETGNEYEEDCDLLIAADGASSKIRASLRPGDVLQFAGAVQMGGMARFDGPIPPPLQENWGSVISGQGVFLFASPVDEKSVIWALSIREPQPRGPFNNKDPKQVQDMLDEARHLGRMLAEPFSTLVEKTDPSTTLSFQARDKKPFRHDEAMGSVVFIGDSNHAVSPFAGNGANMALKDGWDLAEQLVQASSLRGALEKYDNISVPRALASLKTSHSRITLGHCTGVRYWVHRVFFGILRWVLKLTGHG